MFKRKKKKTGCETPTYSRFSMAPEPARPSKPNPNYVPPAIVKPPKPPTSGSNAVKPSELLNMLKTSPVTILPNDISMVTIMCQYETPCGWCCKWDKKCDKKIGRDSTNKPKRGLRANASMYDDAMDPALKDIISGKGLLRLDTNLDPDKPLPQGLRKEIRG